MGGEKWKGEDVVMLQCGGGLALKVLLSKRVVSVRDERDRASFGGQGHKVPLRKCK